MKRLKEINLNVDTSVFSAGQHLNHLNPVKTGYSGQMVGDADSSISRRMQTIFKEEDEESENEMDRDDLLLEMVYNECEKSYVQKMASEQLILHYSNGDMPMNEGVLGAVYETGKAYLEDLVKNLLSSGAVVLSGGLGGDTVVDIIYAIKRTKEVYDIYNGIMNSAGILKDFFSEMEKIKLSNNVEEIKRTAYSAIIKLANENEELLDMAGKTDIYKSAKKKISGAYDTAKKYISSLLEKVKKYINMLKEKFIEFLKSANKSIGDWIGSFIPDDFGAGSALYKGIVNDIINSAMENALSLFLTITEKVPGEIGKIILDQGALTNYIEDMLDSVHKAGDNFFSMEDAGTMKKIMTLGGYRPEFYLSKKAFEMIDFESLKDSVESAMDLYGKIMKYMIAFFAITEGLSSGELQEEIENYNQQKSLEDKKAIQNKLGTNLKYGELDFGKVRDYIPKDVEDNILKIAAENKNKREDLILEKLYDINFLNRRKRRLL